MKMSESVNAIRRLGLVVFAVGIAVTSCGALNTVTVGGQQVYESQWNTIRSTVGPRAAFDLKCTESQLEFSILQSTSIPNHIGSEVNPTQVGVRGCGRQAVYVDVAEHGWVLNSTDTK
jgi:hypothetical protein